MAPSLFLDFETLVQQPVVDDVAAIEAINPHRGCMRLLDAVVVANVEEKLYGAYKDIGHDEFWVAGHIPGRPIFPGVLMIEAAAQLASYICITQMPDVGFMGFGGATDIKFRGQVAPGDRFYVIGKQTELRKRRCTCVAQGVVNGQLVFEATIRGMSM